MKTRIRMIGIVSLAFVFLGVNPLTITNKCLGQVETSESQQADDEQADDEQADNKQADSEQADSQQGNQEKKTPSVEEKSKGWQRFDGFQPFYWDAKGGKIWIEISDWQREFLFVHGLSTGLGSNPVGLDRGQLGQEYVCSFIRVGPKVLMKSRNLNFRSLSDDENQRRAVRESFAESILWGGKVGAESDGRVLVDLTEFLISDIHGVAGRLKRSNQGDYSVDKNRSAIFLQRCKAFPKNTELEATLTYAGKQPGRKLTGVRQSVAQIGGERRPVHLLFRAVHRTAYRVGPHLGARRESAR